MNSPYLGKLSKDEKETLAKIGKKTIKQEDRVERPEKQGPLVFRNDINKK